MPDAELLRSRGIFIAEGRHVVRRLLSRSPLGARSLLVTPPALAALADLLPPHDDLPIYVVGQTAMNAIVGFNIHRGCLAAGERPPEQDWHALAAGARRLIVLDRVSHADNVGAIFRNAAAFGVDGVLLGPACADPLYRKAIRTSMGAALRVPFAHVPEWPADLARLRASGFTIVALTPAPGVAAVQNSLPRGARAALLLGHEDAGISAAALAQADVHARIPMAPAVDSVNVATAAAIALYEWSRLEGIW